MGNSRGTLLIFRSLALWPVVLSTSHGYPGPARKLRVLGAKNYCSIPENKVLQRAYNYEWRKHLAPYDAKTKCRVFVFSVGNEWREHSAPYDAKINFGCLPLRSEMTYGNIRLRMTLKYMSGVCLYVRK